MTAVHEFAGYVPANVDDDVRVPTAQMHIRLATMTNSNTTDSAKKNRAYMRKHFTKLLPLWPELVASGKQGADNMPWPKQAPEHVINVVVSRKLGAE